ncbi:MAG: hypothetical protein AAGJ96_00890 [Pseudomonadota bacterium]
MRALTVLFISAFLLGCGGASDDRPAHQIPDALVPAYQPMTFRSTAHLEEVLTAWDAACFDRYRVERDTLQSWIDLSRGARRSRDEDLGVAEKALLERRHEECRAQYDRILADGAAQGFEADTRPLDAFN